MRKNQPSRQLRRAQGVRQVVSEAWGIAEATSIRTEELSEWTSCFKKKVLAPCTWSHAHATKRYPHTATTNGKLASDTDLACASSEPIDELWVVRAASSINVQYTHVRRGPVHLLFGF